MLACPQGDLFTAQYCTQPVTCFPSSPVMLACPQGDLFTAILHSTCNLFSLITCNAGLPTGRFIYSAILHSTCNLFSLITCNAGLPTGRFIYSIILHSTCNLFSLITCNAGLPTGRFIYSKYCTQPVTCFPSSPVMLACPQGDLFTA